MLQVIAVLKNEVRNS